MKGVSLVVRMLGLSGLGVAFLQKHWLLSRMRAPYKDINLP